jgi:hypothetical protein
VKLIWRGERCRANADCSSAPGKLLSPLARSWSGPAPSRTPPPSLLTRDRR